MPTGSLALDPGLYDAAVGSEPPSLAEPALVLVAVLLGAALAFQVLGPRRPPRTRLDPRR